MNNIICWHVRITKYINNTLDYSIVENWYPFLGHHNYKGETKHYGTSGAIRDLYCVDFKIEPIACYRVK